MTREAQLLLVALVGLAGPAYMLFQIQDQKTLRSLCFSVLVSIAGFLATRWLIPVVAAKTLRRWVLCWGGWTGGLLGWYASVWECADSKHNSALLTSVASRWFTHVVITTERVSAVVTLEASSWCSGVVICIWAGGAYFYSPGCVLVLLCTQRLRMSHLSCWQPVVAANMLKE